MHCTQTRNHKISVLICWKQIDCEWPTKGWLAVAAIAAGADDDVVVVAVAGTENYRLVVIKIKLKFHIRISHCCWHSIYLIINNFAISPIHFRLTCRRLPFFVWAIIRHFCRTQGRPVDTIFLLLFCLFDCLSHKALSQMSSTMRVCFESIENRIILRRYGLVRAVVAAERDNSLRHAHKWENGSVFMFNWTTTIGMQTDETSDEDDILCSICIMCRKKTFECVIDRRRILVGCRNSIRKRAQQKKNGCDSIPQTYVMRTT